MGELFKTGENNDKSLNIQDDTSTSSNTNNAIVIDQSTSVCSLPDSVRDGARVMGSKDRSSHISYNYTPKIIVANVMSLVPKMCEVSEFILRNQIGLAFIAETWLKSSVVDSIIDIPGYSVLRRDRSSDSHGGVCLYVKDNTKYKRLDDLSCCPDHEILWVQLRPNRLPRGFSSLVVAVLYHPHSTVTENDSMREHLFQSLVLAESRFPTSGAQSIVCQIETFLAPSWIMHLLGTLGRATKMTLIG
jgi:hypothetical protein